MKTESRMSGASGINGGARKGRTNQGRAETGEESGGEPHEFCMMKPGGIHEVLNRYAHTVYLDPSPFWLKQCNDPGRQ